MGLCLQGGRDVAGGYVRAPVAPIFVPSLGSLVSDSIATYSPSKQEITRQLDFFGILNSCQECGYRFPSYMLGEHAWTQVDFVVVNVTLFNGVGVPGTM